MGTRADFYVGRGKDAEWLGSIAWDGYPHGKPADVWKATDVVSYRALVEQMFVKCARHATRPVQGWPWPWEDSCTTDYAYAFDEGAVHASCFGSEWFDPGREYDDKERDARGKTAVFPNMKDRQNVNFGDRSGVIFVTPKGIQ